MSRRTVADSHGVRHMAMATLLPSEIETGEPVEDETAARSVIARCDVVRHVLLRAPVALYEMEDVGMGVIDCMTCIVSEARDR